LGIAFEYNGIHHYKWPNYTGQTYEEFIAQVRRAEYKIDQCDRMGVYLITIPYTVPKSRLRDYIDYRAPENYIDN
jgi:hypothetical protein